MTITRKGKAYTLTEAELYAAYLEQQRENDIYSVETYAEAYEDELEEMGLTAKLVRDMAPKLAKKLRDRLNDPDYLDDAILMELEEIVKSELTAVKFISPREADKIIETRIPYGRFAMKDGNRYIGIDNTTGDAWTEEFPSLHKCLTWLHGEDEEDD